MLPTRIVDDESRVIYPPTLLPKSVTNGRMVVGTARMELDNPRKCWGCGNPKSSREHVFAQWMYEINEYSTLLVAEPFLLSDSLSGTMPRKIRFNEIVAKVVCEGCNNGWMSGIEGSVKHLLSPNGMKNTGAINHDESFLLSRWFVKTAAMLNASQRHAYPLKWHPSQFSPIQSGGLGESSVFLSRNQSINLNWKQSSVFWSDDKGLGTSAHLIVCHIQVGEIIGTVITPIRSFENLYKDRSVGVMGQAAVRIYSGGKSKGFSYNDIPNVRHLDFIQIYDLARGDIDAISMVNDHTMLHSISNNDKALGGRSFFRG